MTTTNPKRKPGRPSNFVEAEFLDKACLLFWNKGYDSVSFDDLVAVTGATRRSLYDHYKGKDDVFQHILEHYRHIATEMVQRALANASTPGEALSNMGRTALRLSSEEGRGCLLVNSVVAGNIPLHIRQLYRKSYDELVSMMSKRLIELGVLPKKAATISQTFFIQVQGMHVLARGGASEQELTEAVDGIIAALT